MKIKKRIADNWSLECKDDYQSIREKISFNEHKKNKNKVFIKSAAFSFASIIVVLLLLIPLINSTFDGKDKYAPESNNASSPNNNKVEKPNDSFNPEDEPNYDFPENPEQPDEPGNPEQPGEQPEQPSSPSEPGESEPSEKDYQFFIDCFLKGSIYEPSVKSISYYDSTNNLDNTISNKKAIIDYFNSLEYQKSLESFEEIESTLIYTLTFNLEWGKILFGDHQYVLFSNGVDYILYTTNTDSVWQELQDYLK